jgi:hypothetical protein
MTDDGAGLGATHLSDAGCAVTRAVPIGRA